MPGPTHRKVGPIRLNEVLETAVSRLGLGRSLDDYRIWEAWDQVVGPTIARNAQPLRLKNRRLIVAVRGSTWLHELTMLRPQLVEKLNAWMRRTVIDEIMLVIGKVEGPPKTGPARGSNSPAPGASSPAPAHRATGPAANTAGRGRPAWTPAGKGLSPESVEAFERLWRAAGAGSPPGPKKT